MKRIIGNKWDELLADEWQKPYYQELRSFLIEEYRSETVYPPAGDVYDALRLTDYDDVKAVILGQDPYHEPGQAHGLAFSVPRGTQEPPSLVNILKELESDLGIRYDNEHERSLDSARDDVTCHPERSEGSHSPEDGGNGARSDARGILDPWAKQGVLLLNTVLTVRAHRAASHRGRGWEQFTDRVIELLAEREKPMVFVLWGAQAQAKKELIQRAQKEDPLTVPGMMTPVIQKEAKDLTASVMAEEISGVTEKAQRHLIIEAPHPSPLSAYRGFFGGCYFSRCNYFLEDNGIEPVDWSL